MKDSNNRKPFIKTHRTLHSFKNISPALESMIKNCDGIDYIAIGLAPSTFEISNKHLNKDKKEKEKSKIKFKSNSYTIRLLKKGEILEPDELIIYSHTVAKEKKEDTKIILDVIKNIEYIQDTYKTKLKELILEYDNGGENTFFNNDKETCLNLIHNKIKDIKPIKSNNPNSKDYIEKRLYSYIINPLQLFKVNFKDVETYFKNVNDKNFSSQAINTQNNILAKREEFLYMKFEDLIYDIELLTDSYNDTIEQKLEWFKKDIEDEIDKINLECEKKIDELNKEMNARSHQQKKEESVEYKHEEGPYPSWREDARKEAKDKIYDLLEDFSEVPAFNNIQELISAHNQKIEELYDILAMDLNETYKVHIFHLINDKKRFRTSALTYYKDKLTVPTPYIGKEWKLINQAVYAYEFIERNSNLFQTNIIPSSLNQRIYVDEYFIESNEIDEYTINFLNIKIIDIRSIKSTLTLFQEELNSINSEYADMILFYKYYKNKNFWILLAGHYYDKFLEHTFKKRSFYEIEKLAPKIYNLYSKLQNKEKLTQSLLKRTLK